MAWHIWNGMGGVDIGVIWHATIVKLNYNLLHAHARTGDDAHQPYMNLLMMVPNKCNSVCYWTMKMRTTHTHNRNDVWNAFKLLYVFEMVMSIRWMTVSVTSSSSFFLCIKIYEQKILLFNYTFSTDLAFGDEKNKQFSFIDQSACTCSVTTITTTKYITEGLIA